MNEERVHKKTDGLLWIRPDGSARFLTLWESLVWRVLKRLPK